MHDLLYIVPMLTLCDQAGNGDSYLGKAVHLELRLDFLLQLAQLNSCYDHASSF